MNSVYSVSQVNSYIKRMFEQDFLLNRISVKGEVSNCKYHRSGHIYFTLKDETGAIACVMFAGSRRGLAFQMKDGDKVVVTGTVDVYERDGRYQLYAREIVLEGSGLLYERFLALKAELEEMGMFASEYKQPIPSYVKKLGVVTAPTGAAVRDIQNIAYRRNPYIQLILYPALVQGEGAKESIAEGIETLDRLGLDAIIVGRGGGSIEDLWAFNEELVARAIFNCRTPVISAVGHETDTTIADFVADLRAPTPSAAAELAVPLRDEWIQTIDLTVEHMRRSLRQRLERTNLRMTNGVRGLYLHAPQTRIQQAGQRFRFAVQSINQQIEHRFKLRQQAFNMAEMKLLAFAPPNMLKRGYVLLTDAGGNRITTSRQATPGQPVTVQFHDGYAHAVWQEEIYEKER